MRQVGPEAEVAPDAEGHVVGIAIDPEGVGIVELVGVPIRRLIGEENLLAPVILWQGLVRLTAVCSVLYGVAAGLSQPWEYSLVVFDGAIGLTYVIGMARVTGCSPIELLQCKTTPAPRPHEKLSHPGVRRPWSDSRGRSGAVHLRPPDGARHQSS
jgi:hypothetical protein